MAELRDSPLVHCTIRRITPDFSRRKLNIAVPSAASEHVIRVFPPLDEFLQTAIRQSVGVAEVKHFKVGKCLSNRCHDPLRDTLQTRHLQTAKGRTIAYGALGLHT